MDGGLRRSLDRVRTDLQFGRNREAYAISALGAVLTILGVTGVAPLQVVVSAVLLSLTFLVFRVTAPDAGPPPIGNTLRSRADFEPFPELLTKAATLYVYGPTAVNVMTYAANIRRLVLERGGKIKVIVQDPNAAAKDDVRAQLDDYRDFDLTLAMSLKALGKLRGFGDLEYRLLPFSPGFSLVVVNPDQPNGFLIVEFHGFKDDDIGDRLHIRISRSESLRWFEYWAGRFDAMWDTAREPDPAAEPRPSAEPGPVANPTGQS